MEPNEVQITSFIVKIWVERAEGELDSITWHGQVTRLPGGEQGYVRRLGDIIAFIAPYLESQGLRLPLLWRLRRWVGKHR
jgi:hypothetical protein